MEAEFMRMAALLEADSAKREAISKDVKEIMRVTRSLQFGLQHCHSLVSDEAGMRKLCESTRKQFQELPPLWRSVREKVGEESVEKYRGHWRFAVEQLVFLAALTYWLETHQLIAIEQTIQLIGVGNNDIYRLPTASSSSSSSPSSSSSSPTPSAPITATGSVAPVSSSASESDVSGVGLDLDDYLQGLTALPKELVRLCLNSVRSGNYVLPVTINNFLSDFHSSFRLLNMRNDALRRKFDAIKYDVQKVEEIRYDLKLRGLGEESNTSGQQQLQQQQQSSDVHMDTPTRAGGGAYTSGGSTSTSTDVNMQ